MRSAAPSRVASPLSFRQSLLVAFVCIALLLSGALVRALMALESLAVQNREAALRHMHLVEDIGQMDARTASLERLARQYLVLNDAGLQKRYGQAWESALERTGQLRITLPTGLQGIADEWLTLARETSQTVLQARNARAIDQPQLLEAFARLGALNTKLAQAGKQHVDAQNVALADEVEAQRAALSGLTAAAIGLALLLSFGFGLWLSRPLRQVQGAITRLGEGQFEQPVRIDGPADLRALGGQLDWLRLRLAELEDNKARFLRHVSHELKTPLAALREGVALLEDETAGELSDNQREVAAILRENTIALQEQIEGLLHFNASVFGARQLLAAPVDLRGLLEKVLRNQRMQSQASQLQVQVSGDAPLLTADADKLEVVFTNLLSNAIRFSPRGGTIHLVVEQAPACVRIDCIDSGPGVAPKDVQKIFEPFQQGERQPKNARHGSGIGLAIVREFVHAHGGTVRLVPTAAGAHFRVELPLAPGERGEGAPLYANAPPAESAGVAAAKPGADVHEGAGLNVAPKAMPNAATKATPDAALAGPAMVSSNVASPGAASSSASSIAVSSAA